MGKANVLSEKTEQNLLHQTAVDPNCWESPASQADWSTANGETLVRFVGLSCWLSWSLGFLDFLRWPCILSPFGKARRNGASC